MPTLALSTPTNPISGGMVAGVLTGVQLPATEANSTAGFTGASVPNNGQVSIRVTCTTAGTFQVLLQRTVEGVVYPAASAQQSLVAGTYHFGPFSKSDFNDPSGLLQMTGTFFGGASNNIGAYTLPGAAA